MKYRTISIACMLAVLVSLAVVQSPLAQETTDTTTVSGVIEDISYRPNMVVVQGTEIYGISFNKLERYNISLATDVYVSIEAYEYVCASGESVLKATSITVGDITVALRSLP